MQRNSIARWENNIEIKEPPSIKEVEKFWKKIQSSEKERNEEAE